MFPMMSDWSDLRKEKSTDLEKTLLNMEGIFTKITLNSCNGLHPMTPIAFHLEANFYMKTGLKA